LFKDEFSLVVLYIIEMVPRTVQYHAAEQLTARGQWTVERGAATQVNFRSWRAVNKKHESLVMNAPLYLQPPGL